MRPTGQAVVVAVVLALVFLMGVAPLGDARVTDTDVFWLAAIGRDIAQLHAMPHTNGYSFADGAHPWVMHEGLYGLLFFAGLRALGPAFFTLFGLVTGSATVLVALAWLFGRGRSLAAASASALVVLSVERACVFPRPSDAALLFLVAAFALVMRPGFSLARAVPVVLLELVWTNAHGSFPLGVVLVVVGALDDGRARPERRAWLVTALAAALVTLVNPYGLRLHALVDRYLRGGDATAEVIQSHIQGFAWIWDGFDDGTVEGWSFAALVVVFAVAVHAALGRRHVARVALALIGVAMAVYQVRNIIPAVLLGALLLSDSFDDLVSGGASTPRPRLQGLAIAAAAVIPGLFVGAVRWERAFRVRDPRAWISDTLGGEAFLRLADALPDGAKVYAPLRPVALIMWYESQRGVKVLYDPRNDCYSPDVARGALELRWADEEKTGFTPGSRPVADYLERYGTEYTFATRGVVARDLSRDAAWTPWKRDRDWMVFRYRGAPEAPAPAE